MDNHKGSIFVLGETGQGKSALCRFLCNGSDKFIVNNGTASVTTQVSHDLVRWSGFENKFKIYDTPGLNDSHGRDAPHIREMYQHLSKVSDCSAFLLVLGDPKQPRITGSSKATIEYFRDMFGAHIVQNLAVVFTKVSKHCYEEEIDQESVRDTANGVASIFGKVQNNIPIFYFHHLNLKRQTEDEMRFRQDKTNEMLVWIEGRKPIDCTGAKLVQTKDEKLEQQMANLKLENEKAKKEAEEAKKEAEKAKTASPSIVFMPSPSYGDYSFGGGYSDYSCRSSPSRSSGSSTRSSSSSSTATVYSGRGRPKDTDYTRSGNIRRK